MKKVISLIVTLVLCFTLAVPAFATSVSFVPSITAKPAPEVNTSNTNGEVVVKNSAGETVGSASAGDVIITSVADVNSGSGNTGISNEAAETLKQAYEQLNNEDTKLSELVPELVDAFTAQGLPANHVDQMVVTDMFDVSLMNDVLLGQLAEEGNTLGLTFQTNVPAGQNAFVMVFKDNVWQLVKDVIVSDDGTITCNFDFLGPVAIMAAPAVEAEPEAPAATEEAPVAPEAPAAPEAPVEAGGFAWWWIIVVAAIVIVLVVAKKKGAKKSEQKVETK